MVYLLLIVGVNLTIYKLKKMNHSVSTMSGKTKLKVIFLGNQSVGKTCIIDKYINDRFEETANVPSAYAANRWY